MTVREQIASVLDKRINKDKIITQIELADAFGVSRAAISKMIKTGQVDIDKLVKLCDLLQVTPNELLGYDSNPEDRELLDIINSDPSLKQFVLSRRAK